MALEEDFYGQYKVADVRARAIRRGETLWDICYSEELVPLWLLKKYNKQLDLGTLTSGMDIWIPVVEERTENDFHSTPGGFPGFYPYHPEPTRQITRPMRPTP